MSTWVWIAIAVGVALLVIIGLRQVLAHRRTSHLRDRFGPEYDLAVKPDPRFFTWRNFFPRFERRMNGFGSSSSSATDFRPAMCRPRCCTSRMPLTAARCC